MGVDMGKRGAGIKTDRPKGPSCDGEIAKERAKGIERGCPSSVHLVVKRTEIEPVDINPFVRFIFTKCMSPLLKIVFKNSNAPIPVTFLVLMETSFISS
jgi:hypothetical protein